jgi:ubiquitin carboxyl-terminal hydrolase 25/28
MTTVNLNEGPTDIYAALDRAFDVEEIELESGPTLRYSTITKLPPIMQLYIQRQGFDIKRAESFILKHHVQLDETIYLDRYVESSNQELLTARKASWSFKTRIRKLQEKRVPYAMRPLGVSGSDLLDETATYLEGAADEDRPSKGVHDSLRERAESVRSHIANIDKRLAELQTELNALFANNQALPYSLAAVFVHRGSPRSGHYWIYIRDFAAGVWRKYEDQTVSAVLDANEIFGERDPERDGAPYFVVYVDETRKAAIIEALHRIKPVAVAQDVEVVPPLPDVEMTDAPDANAVGPAPPLPPRPMSARGNKGMPKTFISGTGGELIEEDQELV